MQESPEMSAFVKLKFTDMTVFLISVLFAGVTIGSDKKTRQGHVSARSVDNLNTTVPAAFTSKISK